MLTCDQCRSKLINVGRMIKPGNSEIWADAFVCSKRRCPGYASLSYDRSIARWPGMTLDGAHPLHAFIQGAMKFRDGQG